MKKFFKKILGLKDWHGSAKACFLNTSEKIIGLIISAILISIAGFLIWDVAQKGHKNLDYLTKINYTYLTKLQFSFDVKLVKFSTILTEKSIKKLKDIILSQFYKIEEYVHQSSDLVQFKINYFLNE